MASITADATADKETTVLAKFSLGLDGDFDDGDDDDTMDDMGEEQPRRLLQLPPGCGNSQSLLAYGGDDGTITSLVLDPTTESKKKKKFQIIQRYDDGVRAVAFSPKGKRVVVGFDTGSIRIYKFDDFETAPTGGERTPPSLLHPFVSAPCSNGDGDDDDDFLLSQDHDLMTSHHDMDSFSGPRFDAPIRDLQFVPSVSSSSSKDSFWLMIGTESGMCMINVESTETLSGRLLERECQEHHGHCGIRGISINDDASLMASLAMDGKLCVWNIQQTNNGSSSGKKQQPPSVTLLEREPMTCVTKKDVGEVHGADSYDRSCRPIFHKNLLATPGQLLPTIRTVMKKQTNDAGSSPQNTPTLKTIETTNVEDDGHIESIVSVAFFSSKFMVTSARDRRVILWGYESKTGVMTPLHTVKLDSAATDFCLLDGYRLYAACAKGTCSVLNFDAHCQSKSPAQKKEDENKTEQDSTLTNDSASASPDISTAIATGFEIRGKPDGDDDDDDDIDFSSSSDKPSTTHRVRFLDDEADEDDDDGSQDGITTRKDSEAPSPSDANAAGRSDILDDDGDDGMVDDGDDFDDLPEQSMYQPNAGIAMTQSVPPQPAFSISSTPLDLTRRYLCWNHIGAITIYHGDEEVAYRNKVDINFTDSAFKRPMSFTDNMNFILGSLGEDGAIFASDLQDDEDGEDVDDSLLQENLNDLQMSERTKQAVRKSHKKGANQNGNPTGSSIFFYRFETFGSLRDKDWHLKLPDGERALGSACGKGWAAVMTSRRFLRLFSSGGNQEQLVWLNGEPVTMAGRGRFLVVFYHKASPLPDKTQQLEYTLWDVTSFTVLSRGSLSCISKGASLTWAGFNNDCSLLAMDSDGMLSMLVPCGSENSIRSSSSTSWEWSPVLDTVGLRKSSDDDYWPVWVSDGKLVCVPLKGGNTYPDAGRRPVTTTLGLRIPLAKSAIGKNTALEELSVRSNLALAQKKVVNDIESDDFEQEYVGLCAQVDKVTLKLFASTLDAGKVERALDLVDRLHLEKSYDLAMRLADRNRKLVDLIEDAKDRKFFFEEEEEEIDTQTSFMDRLAPSSQQISPEADHSMKRTKMRQPKEPLSKRTRIA